MGSLREHEEIDPRIASFLAEVARPMRKLPQDRRESLMLELRTHIEKLAEDYEAEGRSPDRAIVDAIAMIGDPKRVGRDYVRAWYRSTEPGGVLAAFGVLTIAQGVASSVVDPFIVRLNVLMAHHSVPGVQNLGTVLMAVVGSIACFVAGWYAPKGAVRAAMIKCLLQSVALILAVVNLHVALGAVVYFVARDSAMSVALAALAVRVRMRRLAGI